MADDVSVIIPVFNGARYLGEAVESVLAQSHRPADIIIVDDGSTDATPDVANSFGTRIRYVRQDNAGLSASRNAGRALAKTSIIAFLDCDDLWHPRKIEWQLSALAREAGPAMIFGQVVQFVSPDLNTEEQARLKFDPTPSAAIFASALLLRNADFELAGPFDTSLRVAEFIEWYGRAQDIGISTVVLPEIVCRRRLHRDNMGRRDLGNRVDFARVMKRIIDRRRQRA
ncbi:MAG: glycosyltransferase family A protein [Rhizomicrobium sp.]